MKNEKESKIVERAFGIIIKGIILVLPFFFLFGKEAEFARQSFLFAGVILLPLGAVLNAALKERIEIKRTPLDVPILLFLLLTFISALSGADKFSAFFGYYGRFNDGWLVMLACSVLFFAAFNVFAGENEKKIISILKILIFSGCATALLLFLTFFGALKFLPNVLTGSAVESFNLFFAILLILAISFYFKEKKQTFVGKKQGLWIYGAFALFIAVLFFVNFQNFSFIKQKFPPAAEIDFVSAKQIALQEIRAKPFLGAGPGFFAAVFSKFRPSDFNQSQYWQIRFDRSYSQIMEWAATLGVAGLLSYFIILGLFIYLLRAYYKKYKTKILEDDILLGLIAGWAILLLGQVIYSGSILLSILFWLILALILSKINVLDTFAFKTTQFVIPSLSSEKSDSNSEASNLQSALRAAFLFVPLIFVAGLLIFVVAEAKYIYAEYCFAASSGQEARLLKAVGNNPHRLNYRIALAKFYLNRAYSASLKNNKDNNSIKSDINLSLDSAKEALAVNPDSILANETLGMIYRDIRPLTVGSEQWCVEFFRRAFELEPTNPVLATELGKAYLNANDIGAAENYLSQALKLKSDYQDAKFSLAKIYAKAGKENDAIGLLTQLASESNEPEVYYELGRLHYNQGEVEIAIGEFKRAVELASNHSNSIYSLGLAYQLLGEKNKALFYFNKALELNPENAEVMERIKEVKE